MPQKGCQLDAANVVREHDVFNGLGVKFFPQAGFGICKGNGMHNAGEGTYLGKELAYLLVLCDVTESKINGGSCFIC